MFDVRLCRAKARRGRADVRVGARGGLPTTLGAALLDLSRMAAAMHPDDISLSLDLPAGILTFRAYRRERR